VSGVKGDLAVADGKRMTRGKLIVIDGTDGSGKATQTALLVKRLKKAGKKVRTISFPRHGHPSGYMVDQYLAGKFGTAGQVGPYRGSMFYAIDRYAASFEIRQWLKQGYIVIADRYVSANMGHQTGKINGTAARLKFLTWLEKLEYKIFGIPKPDLTMLLYMTPIISRSLVRKRGHKQDIHEQDKHHIEQAAKAYLFVAKHYHWPIIDCAPKGKLLGIPEIHDLVWTAVKKRLLTSDF